MKTINVLRNTALVTAFIIPIAFVVAETTPSPTPTPSPVPQPKPQMILQAGPDGRALLRGTISAVNTGSLTVKSWGGDWTVTVSASTEILPEAAGNDLAKFKVGDYVGVQGTVSQTQPWTIEAKVVRDWTYRHEVLEERKQNLEAVHQTMKNETPRNYQGTMSHLSGNAFTLTVEGTAYSISVAANAKILNRNFLTVSLTDFKDGDTVRVWGLRSGIAITAEVVRDISLPRTGH